MTDLEAVRRATRNVRNEVAEMARLCIAAGRPEMIPSFVAEGYTLASITRLLAGDAGPTAVAGGKAPTSNRGPIVDALRARDTPARLAATFPTNVAAPLPLEMLTPDAIWAERMQQQMRPQS
jgi:hypothetical protein